MQVFSSRSALRRGLVSLSLLLATLLALSVSAQQYAPFIFDAEALREWIGQFGVFAPLVFIFILAAQVVVAPIPGQIVALAS